MAKQDPNKNVLPTVMEFNHSHEITTFENKIQEVLPCARGKEIGISTNGKRIALLWIQGNKPESPRINTLLELKHVEIDREAMNA